jgi:predicted enzyme related to lactoylglutathione lyase
MIRETPWPEGTPCWVDLMADDFAKAQAFYGELFGWEVPIGLPDFGGYSTATKDGHTVAGLMPKMDPRQPTGWTTYLASDDLDATMAKVSENGGQVMAPAMDVADMGRMGVAVDAGGTVVGFWQAGRHTGFELANEPGGVVWNENFSADWEANKRFYAAVAGWEYDDMSAEGLSYATFKVGKEPAGGIGKLTDGGAPGWSVYFMVEDADAAVATVQRLGGTVSGEPRDTEFGRMVGVRDDQGAAFLLMGGFGSNES